MRIRPATVDDATGIARVHVRAWQEAYRGIVPDAYLDGLDVEDRRVMWAASLDRPEPGEQVYVAERDAAIVGWLVTGWSRDDDVDEGTAELYGIYTRAAEWGRGTGPALMERAVGLMRDMGAARSTLWTLRDNARARRFYEREGWAFDGATKAFERTGSSVSFKLDQVRYGREL